MHAVATSLMCMCILSLQFVKLVFAAFNYTYEHSQLYLVHTGVGAGGREGGPEMHVFSPAADVTMHLHIDYT